MSSESFNTETAHLDSPLDLAKMIAGASHDLGPQHGLDTSEMDAIVADTGPTSPRSTAGSSAKRFPKSSTEFVPRGEGGSGEGKVPDIIPQSKEQFDGSDDESSSNLEEDFHDPDEPNADALHSATQSTGLKEATPDVENSDLIENIDAYILEKLQELRAEFTREMSALQGELTVQQSAVASLSNKVSSLTIQLAEKRQLVTLGPSAPQDSASSPAPGPKARPVSVTQVPSARGHVEIIQGFLLANPSYPKVKAVRSAKIRALSLSVSFNAPKTDIQPADWTVDGILQHLTSEST